MSPQEAFGIFFILIGCAVPIIVVGVVYYLKKRFEHKQIMAAIEKGTPLSELKPPKQNGALWIKNLTFGIALIIIGIGIGLSGQWGGIIGLVLFAIGIAWVVRAWLNRKYQLQNQPSAKSNAVENRNTTGVSTPETLQPTNE
ncbi:unnamed protein product [marine sediment metagenome]|uniref:DUF6249 domain-containing protein n=1 Tax=marine sediment metagenome TaxID=412755 RepID=X0TVR4_9ZZZZ